MESSNIPSNASDEKSSITLLLEQVNLGEAGAADRLFEVVYEELKQLAGRQMQAENAAHTLQSTALVHEAWIKLVGTQMSPHWKNRGHFFVAASTAMRRILVDAARTRHRKKRGGKNVGVEINESHQLIQRDGELLALDEALDQFREQDPVKAELVCMRFFGGFTMKQIAEHLGLSLATAERHWTFARAWLRKQLAD